MIDEKQLRGEFDLFLRNDKEWQKKIKELETNVYVRDRELAWIAFKAGIEVGAAYGFIEK